MSADHGPTPVTVKINRILVKRFDIDEAEKRYKLVSFEQPGEQLTNETLQTIQNELAKTNILRGIARLSRSKILVAYDASASAAPRIRGVPAAMRRVSWMDTSDWERLRILLAITAYANNNPTGLFSCYGHTYHRVARWKRAVRSYEKIIDDMPAEVYCLEIAVDQDCLLSLSVKTFSNLALGDKLARGKIPINKLPVYRYDATDEKLKTDKIDMAKAKKTAYVQRKVFCTSKNEVEDLVIGKGLDKFNQSKQGIVYALIEELNKFPFIDLEFNVRPGFSLQGGTTGLSSSRNMKLLREAAAGHRIVVRQTPNLTQSESKQAEALAEALRKEFDVDAVCGTSPQRDEWNIELVPPLEKNKEKTMTDYPCKDGWVNQRVTIETVPVDDLKAFSDETMEEGERKRRRRAMKPILGSLLNELCIRQDLVDMSVESFNWSYDAGVEQPIVFAMAAETEDDSMVGKLAIDPEGRMMFKTITAEDSKDADAALCRALLGNPLEETTTMAIQYGDGQIDVIKDTNLTMMVDKPEEIYTALYRDGKISKSRDTVNGLTGSKLDFKYYTEPDEPEFVYYSSGAYSAGLQYGLRGTPIRMVYSDNGEQPKIDVIERLVDLPFGRVLRERVYPFPIKYLEELMRERSLIDLEP